MIDAVKNLTVKQRLELFPHLCLGWALGKILWLKIFWKNLIKQNMKTPIKSNFTPQPEGLESLPAPIPTADCDGDPREGFTRKSYVTKCNPIHPPGKGIAGSSVQPDCLPDVRY